jgi:two-component system, NarL family, sensor histidine kinase UhpB
MRDMHDGIGGQLMSLLFAARQKALPPEELTQGLRSVIDELRLIIDSLDTVGESLGAALASFRSRIEPRLSAAGIAIDWSNDLPEGLPELPPHTVLQVFRIVQEAITNAIKHSGTKALGVAIGLDESKALRIAISDSGAGFDPAAAAGGRGLENMAARAAAIGGALKLESNKAGTTVILTVPFSE